MKKLLIPFSLLVSSSHPIYLRRVHEQLLADDPVANDAGPHKTSQTTVLKAERSAERAAKANFDKEKGIVRPNFFQDHLDILAELQEAAETAVPLARQVEKARPERDDNGDTKILSKNVYTKAIKCVYEFLKLLQIYCKLYTYNFVISEARR